MSRSGDAVLREALELPEEERAEIAGALLESLEPPVDEGVDEAWREEVARRIAAFDAGEIEAISWEKVRDELWAKMSEGRRR
jgi:putative addiction module component (TIGR02574 family)